MPRRDGTGPTGKGPMTGRKLGNCSDINIKKEEEKKLQDKLEAIKKKLEEL